MVNASVWGSWLFNHCLHVHEGKVAHQLAEFYFISLIVFLKGIQLVRHLFYLDDRHFQLQSSPCKNNV